MVVVRKNVSKEQGDVRLIDEIRYFFYSSNDMPRYRARTLFFGCNDRCDQEKFDRTTLRWSSIAVRSSGQFGKQLGVYGDNEYCMEPKILVCTIHPNSFWRFRLSG